MGNDIPLSPYTDRFPEPNNEAEEEPMQSLLSSKWCEHCQSHTTEGHYDEEGNHKVGAMYGRMGDLLYKEKELEEMKKDALEQWTEVTTMVRVLMDMPEEDAIWLRNHLAASRADIKKPVIEVFVYDKDHKGLEMHIREILIYG